MCGREKSLAGTWSGDWRHELVREAQMNNAAPDKVAVATYTGAAFSSVSIMPRSDALQLLSLHTEWWKPLLKSGLGRNHLSIPTF